MSKRCLSNKYKPGKEPEEVAESETAEAEGVSKEEHMRLEKCKIIHYVDSNFAQKGLDPPEKGPPKVALYQEIWEAHPDMLLANGRSRKATGVRDLFNTIFRHSCVRNTTWKAFFEDPKGCLKDDKLRYDEYCASIKPSPHTETSSVAESEPLTTPAKSADIQTSSTAGDPESTAHLANRGVTVSALSEDLLNHEFTRPHTEQQVVPNISTHERSDLAGGVPSGTQSFNHESSLSIPTRSSAQANGEPQQPDFDKSQAPIDPSLSTSKASKAAQSEVVACVQHKLELSGSRLFGPEAAPSQRRFACSKLGCGYETVWFSLSDIEHMRAAWPSDDVSQRPSPIMPPKRPNIVPRPDATRYHLDTGSLSRSLQDMFARIKSQIHQAFEDRGIEHGQAARLVINARTGVQQLYEVIIGDVDPSGNKDRIVTTVSAEDLGMSMFGAFLFSNVLSGSSEETFDQFQAKFDFAAEETDKVLQELRSDRDTVLRNVYIRRLHDKSWVQKTFVHMADRLAEDFALRFEEHLSSQIGAGPQKESPSMYRLAKRFSQIISDALVMKCKISSARKKYEFVWSVGNDMMEAHLMEAPQGDQERVLLTTFPGLLIREDGPHPRVLFKAQVEAGPSDE